MDTPEQDELLQRYVDGDLSSAERVELETRLQREPLLSAQLRSLRRLHSIIVTSGEYEASKLDSEALFSRISSAVGVEPAVVKPPVRQPSFLERLLRGGFWMPAGGALAVAAAVLLTVYLPMDNTQLEENSKLVTDLGGGTEEGAAQEPATLAALPVTGAEVVQVDFGNNAGTVFEIALAGGASTPVVWINDEEE